MIKQLKPRVLKRDTKAIIATGRRVVLRSPKRGLALYGDGKYPSRPRVACGTKEDVKLGIVLMWVVTRVKFKSRREVEICGGLKVTSTAGASAVLRLDDWGNSVPGLGCMRLKMKTAQTAGSSWRWAPVATMNVGPFMCGFG
jgi:hypothetical protein